MIIDRVSRYAARVPAVLKPNTATADDSVSAALRIASSMFSKKKFAPEVVDAYEALLGKAAKDLLGGSNAPEDVQALEAAGTFLQENAQRNIASPSEDSYIKAKIALNAAYFEIRRVIKGRHDLSIRNTAIGSPFTDLTKAN